MSRSKKVNQLLGIVIGLAIILGLFLFSNNIFLSPDGANMGCATQDQDPPKGKLVFRLFPEPRPIYNNCAVDSMAQINAELCQSVSLKPHSLECGQHFEHPKIEHLFKPRLLSRGGASIF